MPVVTLTAPVRTLRLLLSLLLAAAILAGLPAGTASAQTTISDCSTGQVAGIVAQLEAGGHFVFAGNCTTAMLDVSVAGRIDIRDGVTTEIEGNGVTFRNTINQVFGVQDAGVLSLSGVTISGGGITTIGTLTVIASTFSNNARFGAILNIAVAGGMASVTIMNSTFSENAAPGFGSAIQNFAFGGAMASVTITSSTFSGNTASTGGTLHNNAIDGTANVTLTSSMFAASSSAHCVNHGGTITSDGYNLADANDTSCFSSSVVTGDQVVADAGLGALEDNGGPTLTHLLDSDSPAIDQGGCEGLTTDQRGLPRIVNLPTANAADGCDVGAIEFQGIATDLFELRGGSNELESHPTIVRRQAGDPIYVRFTLGGDYGSGILSAALVQPISCTTGDPIGSPQPAQTVGGLRYVAGAGYYQIVWRTQRSWANTCRQFVLQFSDGSEVRFNVQFTPNR